ncbi:unnamed protein product [Calypogeia fissa]
MAGDCKQQCERKCQVWQLAVGGESNPNPHMHMPCLPGGGRPGSGLQFRTYEGGCRSVCSGSVRHPVQHLYPAGRMKKWFFDTKEWFWDGMFVMKTENPTKSASHYCLPFPRPTMRLPRLCNSRLVEVHHVHPPPSNTGGVAPDESGDGAPPQNSAKSATPPRTPPVKEGSEAQHEVGSDVLSIDSRHSDPSESQASEKPSTLNQTRETDAADAAKETIPQSGNVVRISHVNVEAGSPPSGHPGEPQRNGGGGKDGNPTDHPGELTYVNYRAFSLCPRLCHRTPGWFPCIPAQWKFWVRRGVAVCFTLTASACLCLSSTCATLSFCVQNVARNLDGVATTAVDVKELVNCYVFVADMPGLKHSDIKVQVENDSVLKISGEQMRDDYAKGVEINYIRVERNIGARFLRKFNLPADTNLDSISAACQDGLLTVIVPKIPHPDSLRPRSFDVNVHSANVLPPQTAPQSL